MNNTDTLRRAADYLVMIGSGEAATLAASLRAMADEGDALRAEAANLRTVMVAAAEEIAAHWQAHCDADGYGPANLMHRLEEGIPSEYGYTAGAFAALRAENERLRADAERYRWLRSNCECMGWGSRTDAAIDAARGAGEGAAGVALNEPAFVDWDGGRYDEQGEPLPPDPTTASGVAPTEGRNDA